MTVLDQKASPMMEQWQQCKLRAGNALLFFRMGDFYEAFYDDAVVMARELELTLTKRQEVPMCGVPHHASEAYIDRLLVKGHKIAIAEQTEDPRQAKGLVKREVVRMITPGTVITSSLLSETTNNFIAAISRVGQVFGFAILDLTTAEFYVMELENEQELFNEIYRIKPTELVVYPKMQAKHSASLDEMRNYHDIVLSTYDDWHFEHQAACDFLTNHFKVRSLDGFGLRGMTAAINAAGGLLSYLQDALSISLGHITELQLHVPSRFMAIDQATRRHLELMEPLNNDVKNRTLLSVIDHTQTPMGARLLKQWMKQPLMDVKGIEERQDAVQAFYQHPQLLEDFAGKLNAVRDLERLIMRVSSGNASPRDLVALKHSCEPLALLKSALRPVTHLSHLLNVEEAAIEPLPEMVNLIQRALVEEPPMRLSDGNIFKDGYCQELDALRIIGQNSQAWLTHYQGELKQKTGIKTLKVGFNRMFGYYIEVSKGQAERMPDAFQRRQTLVNAERFITPELKEYESKVLHAEERISAIENELFATLRQEIAKYAQQIQRTAQAIARIDCIQGLATAARRHNYARPVVDKSSEIQIIGGRHPIIEVSRTMTASEKFIANDTLLNGGAQRLLLITGPNMAGKSTYIRQVALIAILAQMGSFVPATQARIGIIDKVFSRIGASDDLSRGHSTFMVEMTETANILNNATSRSLVILDEIGRGTSTYDGIAIAWAVAEHLLLAEGRQAKTLFATHYWELTKLEEKVPGAVNYHVAVHESNDGIIFLRKIVRGGTDKSYGIHVGRLAGLPGPVITRAKEILLHLEENANRKSAFEPAPAKQPPPRPKKRSPFPDLQMTFDI